MDKTLVVLAAGMGSRFGGLKQIEAVGNNGEFIIDYSIYDAIRAGFKKVVFVIKEELLDTFRETIGKRIEGKIKVEYAFQKLDDIKDSKKYLAAKRVKPWGTVQALLCAKPYVDNDFVVINADDFYGQASFVKAYNFLEENNIANNYASINFPYIMTASNFGSVKRAVCKIKDGKIYDLVEAKITTKDNKALCEPLSGDASFFIELQDLVAVNMFAFKKEFFAYLEEFFDEFFNDSDEEILKKEALLTDVIKKNLEENKIILNSINSPSKWLGMTYRKDLPEVHDNILKLIKEGEYPENLWENYG